MSNKDEFQKVLQIVHPDEYRRLGIAIQKGTFIPYFNFYCTLYQGIYL